MTTMTSPPRVWGFLRETSEQAVGKDPDTGLHRTGLDEYLKAIFPETDDWIHNKTGPFMSEQGEARRVRPDYRSESLKLIVEFDGIQHYTSPENILKDAEHTAFYESNGYKVVRIPYFIQLTNRAVQTMFGISVPEPLFDESVPSMGVKGKNTPAYLCYAGLLRMAKDFKRFPEQYLVNVRFLESQDNQMLTGVDFLKREYEKL